MHRALPVVLKQHRYIKYIEIKCKPGPFNTQVKQMNSLITNPNYS